MKILVGLNTRNILDYLDYTNSFIIGLKDFSINYQEYSIDEIRKLRNNYPKIELFISINKNIFNCDLKILEENLQELNKIDIRGVFFYDLSILSIVMRNNFTIPLVWAQEHMTTNYNTCNYYSDKKVEYAYLSCEITVDEIKEIKERSHIKLISFFFGYPDVSFSKRKLLTNYFLYHNSKKENDWYTISSDDNNKYFIKENSLGTRILYGNILNGIKPFYDLNKDVDYGILNEELIDHDIFMKALKIFFELNNKKISALDAEKSINDLVNSDDTVFFYKKTIYKVKDEK